MLDEVSRGDICDCEGSRNRSVGLRQEKRDVSRL